MSATSQSSGKSRGCMNLRPFQKGQSGNPGGRKKDSGVKALAREYTVEAIETLGRILRDAKATPSAQVQAATALLDRGWGKPLAQVEVGSAGEFERLTDAELDDFIEASMAKLKAHKATLQ